MALHPKLASRPQSPSSLGFWDSYLVSWKEVPSPTDKDITSDISAMFLFKRPAGCNDKGVPPLQTPLCEAGSELSSLETEPDEDALELASLPVANAPERIAGRCFVTTFYFSWPPPISGHYS